ncbi:Kinesin light chain [Metarhizium anisopliae]|nr:Kinesin light chain [Metarhizium anisopliae]
MAQDSAVYFGPRNEGSQVGFNIGGTIINEFLAPPERRETPPQPFASIPFPPDPDFVTRGDILDQVIQRCSQPAGRVALVGLGGVGKSQLAIESAHQIAEAQGNIWVFWIHAATRARVEEGFRTIADVVKLTGRNQPKANIPLLVQNWLSNERNGSWVIVLDSADYQGVFYDQGDERERPLATYLPQSQNGSIVITTRNKHLASRLTGGYKDVIEVGPMIEADALTLLRKKLGTLSNTDLSVDLIKALDYIPLAIIQAAAYIQANYPRSSVANYLAEFRKSERQRASLLKHHAGDLRRDGAASNAVLTTWHISFDHIRSQRSSAADLLSFMSFFDPQSIPDWAIKPFTRTTSTTRGRDQLNAQDSDRGSCSDTDADSNTGTDIDSYFEDDISMLRDYCLITTNEDGGGFEMHGLVQLSTRKWLDAFGQQGTFKEKFIKQMASLFPTWKHNNWATCEALFTHVQLAINYRPTENTVEEWASLCQRGGLYAWQQGKYDIAQRMLEQAKKTYTKRLGEDDSASLQTTSMIATVVLHKGQWEEAEKMFEKVIDTQKTKLGADHPDTLTSMANLVSTFYTQDRWEEAEKLGVQVIDTQKTKLGADHPNTLTSMANLASIFWKQGRWEEAEKLFKQVIDTQMTKLGADHPDTLTSMGNLAFTYREQGQWEEAEKMFKQVIDTQKTKVGTDHPDTLTSMAELASTYREQGQWEEAEKLFKQVIDTQKTKLGADHPKTLTSMGILASTFWKQGQWEKAKKLFMQLIETRKTKLGADHPNTLMSMGNLALTFWKQGQWQEAEKLFKQVIDTQKTKLGADHPDTLTSMGNLALTFLDQCQWEEAEKMFKQVTDTWKTKVGADHPKTLTSMANLASTFWKQGRWEEAEKLDIQVIESYKTKLGADHPNTLSSMANLASTYWKQGQWEEAEKLFKQVIDTQKTKLGADHPDTLSSMDNLATCLEKAGSS